MASIYKNGELVRHVNNASMPQIETLIAMGIDPKTGLPYKFGGNPQALKDGIRKNLRVLDEQQAIRSFAWYNLPNGLTGDLMERILYYKGQGMLFYMDANDTFYFLPFALDGEIDVYGRYTGVTPLPFNGVSQLEKDGKQKPWITGLVRKPVYDIKLDKIDKDFFLNSCVLLSDYSKQISQTTISRQTLQEPIIEVMSDCVPFLRTALLNSTGVLGMRVNSQDEYSNVEAASKAIDRAALEGKKYVPVVGNVDFQDLTGGEVVKSEEFLMAYQALDNLRKSFHGLDSNGIYQKASHMLQSEQSMNASIASLTYEDRLLLRQDFCDIVNSIWGLGISCEPSESVLGIDQNLDGIVVDQHDQSGIPGQQPAQGETINE